MIATDSRQQTYLAVVIILTAVFAMSLQAIAMKYVSSDLTIWQITIFRSLIILSGMVPFIVIGWRRGRFRLQHLGWTGIRGTLMVTMNFLYYGSLPLMDISVAATAFYTGPIFIFIMAIVLMGERVNAFGVLAIVCGFLGAFMVINPGGNDFGLLVLLPMLSAIAYGSASIITRMKCQGESAFVMATMVHVCFLVAGLVGLFLSTVFADQLRAVTQYEFVTGDWTPMTLEVWAIMLGLAALNATTHLGFAKAYQAAPSSIIATWEYTYLLFVAALGFFIFAEIPDAQTVAGMVMIVGSGLLILFSASLARAFQRQRV